MRNSQKYASQQDPLQMLFCSRHWEENDQNTHLPHLYSAMAVICGVLSILVTSSNVLMLIALHKDTSLHPPSKLLFRSLTSTDLCIGLFSLPLSAVFLMSATNEVWAVCRFVKYASYAISATLSGVSLTTLSAISVDRLLALLLGMRYRQVVTVQRVRIAVFLSWVKSTTVALLYIWSKQAFFIASGVLIFLELAIPTYCYQRIFRTIRRRRAQVQDKSERNSAAIPNVAKYKRTVTSALWVHLTLAACYLPFAAVVTVTAFRGLSPPLFLAEGIAAILVFMNSLLNPGLYCWKIKEVRRAVKETIRQICSC